MSQEQSWRIPVFLAALGIIGTLVGASATYIFSTSQERLKAFKEQQREAYVAFADAMPKWHAAQMPRPQVESSRPKLKTSSPIDKEYGERETEAEIALRRMVLYGDSDVVRAAAEWYKAYPSLPPCDDPQWNKGLPWKNELAVWEAMRRSALAEFFGEKQYVSPEDLAPVVLHCRIK